MKGMLHTNRNHHQDVWYGNVLNMHTSEENRNDKKKGQFLLQITDCIQSNPLSMT
jgi:hypothetical protein